MILVHGCDDATKLRSRRLKTPPVITKFIATGSTRVPVKDSDAVAGTEVVTRGSRKSAPRVPENAALKIPAADALMCILLIYCVCSG